VVEGIVPAPRHAPYRQVIVCPAPNAGAVYLGDDLEPILHAQGSAFRGQGSTRSVPQVGNLRLQYMPLS
jgi:hypothetical protein